jgi:1-deoxy-D-xylulose-5-phosphate reductoisomerase
LLYPERVFSDLPRLDPLKCGPLEFRQPDEERFPALRVARQALQAGGTMPAVMNAANESSVALFMERRIGFLGIMELVQAVIAEHRPVEETFDNVLEADGWARAKAIELAAKGGYR